MRATAFVLAAAFGLTMLSVSAAQAGPVVAPPDRTAAAAITLVAAGCGPGFVPRTYRDAYGRPFTECVPMRPVPRCAPGWHWRTWRDAYGRPHGKCVP